MTSDRAPEQGTDLVERLQHPAYAVYFNGEGDFTILKEAADLITRLRRAAPEWRDGEDNSSAAGAGPFGQWQAFDPAIMQELGFYIVEFSDGSVGMDTRETEDGWQQIEPEATVAWIYLLPRRK